MGQRVIPVAVTAEYIGGDGVTLGAAGSHNSVVIEYDFRAAGPMWDDPEDGTLIKYVLWTNPQGNTTNRVDLGVDKLVDGYDGKLYHASPTADAMCVAGWAEMVVVGAVISDGKEVAKVKTEPSRFRVMPGSSSAADNEGLAATVADQLQTEIETVDGRKVSKPLTPLDPDGTDGQFLVSRGNGLTEWADMDQDVVETVLEKHPEWVTKVQDGAVSKDKLAEDVIELFEDIDTAILAEKASRESGDALMGNRIDAADDAILAEKFQRETGDALLGTRIDGIIAPTGEAPSAAEVADARIGADGKEYASLGAAVRGQAEQVKDAINMIREHTTNLFDPDLVINAYFTGAGNKIILNDNTRTVYIPCKPSTKYVVTKMAGGRFAVGYMTQLPEENAPVTVTGANYTASRLSITTGEDAAYLVAWVFAASYDTDITADDMLATVMIQEGAATEDYVTPFSAVDINLRDKLDANGVSCLGALPNGTDLDGLDGVDHNGFYIMPIASVYSHDPVGAGVRRCLFILPDTDNYYVQMIINLAKGTGYIRDHTGTGGWGEWVYMGDYLGSLPSGTDLDNVDGTQNGYYSMAYSAVYSHDPIGASSRRVLRVYQSTSASYYQQHIMDAKSGKMFMRYHTGSGGWSDWVSTSVTAQPALACGAAYQVRFPFNAAGDPDPYTAKKKVVSLLHFSDIHQSGVCLNTLMVWAKENSTFFDDILCTGDLVNYYDEETGVDYMSFWTSADGTEDILVTIGNHDAKDQSGSGNVPGWKRKEMARSRELYQYGMDNWGVTAPEGKTYWYKDYDGSDLRLIGIDATVVPAGTEDMMQQGWLADVLEDAREAGKAVVIAQHYPPIENDGSAASMVLCDFNAITRPVSHNAYLNMPAAYPAIVQDYIDAGGEFVCWLAGHAHTDHVAYISTYPDQIYFVVSSLWNDLRYSDQARPQGTPSLVAANLIGFDTDRKVIKIVRVGANYDYDLRPREYLVYNYDTKTIVRQASGTV